MAGDDWQIEVLCNVGAAELLMPVGSFISLRKANLSIEDLLDERKTFQVSTEAIFIRYAKLALTPCAGLVGRLFGYNSVVAECNAIGFTPKGEERELDGSVLRVEAVGLPPYPGHLSPRVAGVLSEPGAHESPASAITYVRGDALAPRGAGKKVVAHIVNDKTTNWGGGGFAVAAKKKWPEAHREFVDKVMASGRELLTLGKTTRVKVDEQITLFNIVAQHGYGDSPSPRIRYSALEVGLEKLAEYATTTESSVHMPRIGTGNARGSWK